MKEINAVKSISWCGVYSPDIRGCTKDGRIIVEYNAAGGMYGHEYGHAVGLDHRGGNIDDFTCKNSLLMYSAGGVVNQHECEVLGGHAYTQLSGMIYDGRSGPLTFREGPYWVSRNITVPSRQNLTIQSNVEIQFDEGQRLTVYGTLTIDGRFQRTFLYGKRLLWEFF